MSERRFVIYEVGTIAPDSARSITESEFHRRIDLAFRAAFCTLDEKFDFNKAVEILVLGEGWDQHDLPGCEEEAGPNWKVGEKGECPNCGKIGGCDCTPKGYIDQPFPAPVQEGPLYTNRDPEPTQPTPVATMAEWEEWADCAPDISTCDWNYTEYRRLKKAWFLSMPIVKAQANPSTRAEHKLWIQDLPRPGVLSWNDVDIWLDAVEIWLEHGPWMPKE